MKRVLFRSRRANVLDHKKEDLRVLKQTKIRNLISLAFKVYKDEHYLTILFALRAAQESCCSLIIILLLIQKTSLKLVRACHRVHGAMRVRRRGRKTTTRKYQKTFTVKGMPQPAIEMSVENLSSSDVDLSSKSESDDLLSISNECSEEDRPSSDVDLSSEPESVDLCSKFAKLYIF